MSIESDQLVFDYLSRVGDLAQQRQLPSAMRMRLVTELRGEIDRHRAKVTVDSPAAVRRILDRLGSPDQIVGGAQEKGARGAGGAGADPAAPLTRPLPEQPTGRNPARGGLRRKVPRPRREARDPDPVRDEAPAPPHLAGTDELGSAEGETDWWRIGDGPGGVLTETDSVPGFVGGVEIPDILRAPGKQGGRPDLRKKPVHEPVADEPEADEDDEGAEDASGAARRGRRAARPRLGPVGGWTNPLLLLAAAALVAGAVLGNILPLVIGWGVVYLSRRLTLGQKKLAVFALPGLAAAAGIVWLWGRTDGRWGEPIADGRMSGALNETWPWVLRGAAIASALYLVWRSQRPRG
ncbi:hypothetical protein [Streptomyces longispororuber]|uniref:hypothetical protein n=1 Tax=Streptomyces longispororuber TaxID=68230 RepID=UPI002108EA24|nr:hypothetical protein [Streptomyces longispororuber]MCQ4209722.1 hypothetical protein [Streptomyces longispororuber]